MQSVPRSRASSPPAHHRQRISIEFITGDYGCGLTRKPLYGVSSLDLSHHLSGEWCSPHKRQPRSTQRQNRASRKVDRASVQANGSTRRTAESTEHLKYFDALAFGGRPEASNRAEAWLGSQSSRSRVRVGRSFRSGPWPRYLRHEPLAFAQEPHSKSRKGNRPVALEAPRYPYAGFDAATSTARVDRSLGVTTPPPRAWRRQGDHLSPRWVRFVSRAQRPNPLAARPCGCRACKWLESTCRRRGWGQRRRRREWCT
jgi:hypothetical protein